jgi:hypothetical protein
MIAYPLIYSFIMSAKDNDILIHRHCICHFLVQSFSVRRHVNNFIIGSFTFRWVMQASMVVRSWPCQPRPPGIIVYTFLSVGRIITQVMKMNLHQSFVDSCNWSFKGLRNNSGRTVTISMRIISFIVLIPGFGEQGKLIPFSNKLILDKNFFFFSCSVELFRTLLILDTFIPHFSTTFIPQNKSHYYANFSKIIVASSLF